MNHCESSNLDELIAAQLEGRSPNVPESQRAEFEQALAAHQALQGMLQETFAQRADITQCRSLPALPEEYEIEREIGQGGMGVVYLVHQRSLNRDVALKVLRPGEQTFGPMLKRFLAEAQHLARLRHPNIVSIHHIGDAGGEPFFTMDYIDGSPLSAEIQRGRMSPTQALSILKQVCHAVQHAHRQGIIHRDLKPSNVLLDREGNAFVTDFGLARDVSGPSDLTLTGEVLGTPQYMAPEQARGQTSLVGEATDVHALGLLLFEMLTGRAAFASSSPADVLVRLLHDEAPSLRSFDRRIPQDLDTICQKALQKSPDARYSSVSALLEDIRRFEAGEPLVARRTGPLKKTFRWAKRHWKFAATVAATAIIAVLVAGPLFDKSFDDLVAWGDEEVARGRIEVAAQVYSRALEDASEKEKLLIVDRIVQTCRTMEDPKSAVDLAMQIIDIAPTASFGKYDYLVSQAVVAREHGDQNLGTVNVWSDKPEPTLKLVKSRLELALQSELPEAEKLRTESMLDNVNLAIADGAYPARFHPDYLHQLPNGNLDELSQMLASETTAPWTRGRAGMALGQRYETLGRDDEAIAAYRQAYELMRSVYPMYAGVKVSRGSTSSLNAPDAEECVLVRQLVNALHRLDPDGMPLPKGRVEFDVVGVELPPTVQIDLELKLSDPSIKDPNQGLPHNLPRLIPLRQDQPVGATVLDGVYRLHPAYSYHMRSDDPAAKIGRLLLVDVPKWPEEIEVRGDLVKLPPVRLRLAEEIVPNSPPNHESVKLHDMELRWSAIPNTSVYRVHLWVRMEGITPSASMFLSTDTDVPRLRLADLKEHELRLIRENLIQGSVCEWHVDAYDDNGKIVGRTIDDWRFQVAAPLAEEVVSR